MDRPISQNVFEKLYANSPRACRAVDVLFVGAGIGLASAIYLLRKARQLGIELTIAVADAGPFDMLTHMAHTSFPRHPVIQLGTDRVGGRLPMWGVSTPRPPETNLDLWPYEKTDLLRRFEEVERELGVPDRLPMSGLALEKQLFDLCRRGFPENEVRSAPLAINRDGRRWCPLDLVPEAVTDGLRILSNFRCQRLCAKPGHVSSVVGQWGNGKTYNLRPKFIVVGVGVDRSLPLLHQIAPNCQGWQPADHLRIDLHGVLPRGHFGEFPIDDLGIGVLLMEYKSQEQGIPAHFEIKVAPKALWARGFMQSSDNLRGADTDETLYAQIQCVSAMHDRIPIRDLLSVNSAIPPVMSARDASLHGELVSVMRRLSCAIGLANPTFCLRPLLTNHHCYGAYRVGTHVSADFQFLGFDNLFVLPPTAYVDFDDDANPTLKSLVLAQYAMDEILVRLREEPLEEEVPGLPAKCR